MDGSSYPAAPTGEKFLDVPYEQRWEKLRPVIVDLYLGGDGRKGLTCPQLASVMKEQYDFIAV